MRGARVRRRVVGHPIRVGFTAVGHPIRVGVRVRVRVMIRVNPNLTAGYDGLALTLSRRSLKGCKCCTTVIMFRVGDRHHYSPLACPIPPPPSHALQGW